MNIGESTHSFVTDRPVSGKHVFNRTVDERGELTGAKIMAFYLTAFVENGTTPEKLRHFEEIVSKWGLLLLRGSLAELLQHIERAQR